MRIWKYKYPTDNGQVLTRNTYIKAIDKSDMVNRWIDQNQEQKDIIKGELDYTEWYWYYDEETEKYLIEVNWVLIDVLNYDDSEKEKVDYINTKRFWIIAFDERNNEENKKFLKSLDEIGLIWLKKENWDNVKQNEKIRFLNNPNSKLTVLNNWKEYKIKIEDLREYIPLSPINNSDYIWMLGEIYDIKVV